MDFGPEDLLEFGRYYLPSLLCSLVACAALLAASVIAARLRLNRRRLRILLVGLTPLPLVCWVVYYSVTAELSYTLVLLGSESSQVAERTYFNRFKKQVSTLDAAVRLAVNKHQEPNVRFYASCLIADMLTTNQDMAVKAVFQRVKEAEVIETEFFDGNTLTDGFYVPGHAQVQLPVRDIVERRLLALRAGAMTHKPTDL